MEPTTGSKKPSRDNTQENLIEVEALKELIETIPLELKTRMLDSLRIFPRAAALPPHYENEIVQALTEHFREHPAAGSGYRETIKQLRRERMRARNAEEKIPKAKRDDYDRLYETVLGPLPRDIFSGKCMVQHDGLWEPAQNFLRRCKSLAASAEEEGILKYNMDTLDNHFFDYECIKPRIFIPTVPQWDGKDRLKELAEALQLDGSQDFPSNAREQFTKAFIAGVFRKMQDPSFQNPVLILKGPQHAGKDTWLDTLCGGFDQWFKDMTLTHNDKDNYTQLSRAAVLRIAEFERTAKTDLATIKDMIFRKFTFLRPSHQPEFRDAQCRASFVASCNTDDIYRDSTGNRRFVVFNIERIAWNYDRSSEAQKQILAQARALAADNYQPSPMALDAMARFLEEKTPESIEALTVERWELEVRQWISANPTTADEVIFKRTPYWITNEEANKWGIFERVMKAVGIQLRTVRQHLKAEGLGFNAYPSRHEPRSRGFLIEQPEHLKNTEKEGSVRGIDFD